MDVPSQRRKACDLCFVKKIKCDMLKPTCSNCLLYKAECHTTRLRRKQPAPARDKQQQQQQQAPAPPSESSRVADLENRLATIEGQLQQVLEATVPRGTASSCGQPPASVPGFTVAPDTQLSARSLLVDPHLHSPFLWPPCNGTVWPPTPDAEASAALGCTSSLGNAFLPGSTNPSERCRAEDSESSCLPPLEEVLPFVDIYFQRFNNTWPLFHQPTFRSMMLDWYNNILKRDMATWAVINIVLAMGHRLNSQDQPDSRHSDENVSHFMRNAQSTISELAMREKDVKGLQVILGLLFLFLGTREAKPIIVLIGTAVRQAHRMGLHDKLMSQYLSAEEGTQRLRLFWIVYTLDKDISLRARVPYFQQDADIDLPPPDIDPPDGASVMVSNDGSTKFNHFRFRVALSHILGRINDLLYSTRARKATRETRRMYAARLNGMLEQWLAGIPPQFQMDQVVRSTSSSIDLGHLTVLYGSYMSALVLAHGEYSNMATDWCQEIQSYLRSCMTLGEEEDSLTAPQEAKKSRSTLPSLWFRWVSTARKYLHLILGSPKRDSDFWTNGIACFTSLVIVLTNMVIHPLEIDWQQDECLSRKTIEVFREMAPGDDEEKFWGMYKKVVDLHRHASEMARDAAVNGSTKRYQPARMSTTEEEEAASAATFHDEELRLWMGDGNQSVGDSCPHEGQLH